MAHTNQTNRKRGRQRPPWKNIRNLQEEREMTALDHIPENNGSLSQKGGKKTFLGGLISLKLIDESVELIQGGKEFGS